MSRFGEELFAGTALSQEEKTSGSGRRELEHCERFAHRRAVPDDAVGHRGDVRVGAQDPGWGNGSFFVRANRIGVVRQGEGHGLVDRQVGDSFTGH